MNTLLDNKIESLRTYKVQLEIIAVDTFGLKIFPLLFFLSACLSILPHFAS